MFAIIAAQPAFFDMIRIVPPTSTTNFISLSRRQWSLGPQDNSDLGTIDSSIIDQSNPPLPNIPTAVDWAVTSTVLPSKTLTLDILATPSNIKPTPISTTRTAPKFTPQIDAVISSVATQITYTSPSPTSTTNNVAVAQITAFANVSDDSFSSTPLITNSSNSDSTNNPPLSLILIPAYIAGVVFIFAILYLIIRRRKSTPKSDANMEEKFIGYYKGKGASGPGVERGAIPAQHDLEYYNSIAAPRSYTEMGQMIKNPPVRYESYKPESFGRISKHTHTKTSDPYESIGQTASIYTSRDQGYSQTSMTTLNNKTVLTRKPSYLSYKSDIISQENSNSGQSSLNSKYYGVNMENNDTMSLIPQSPTERQWIESVKRHASRRFAKLLQRTRSDYPSSDVQGEEIVFPKHTPTPYPMSMPTPLGFVIKNVNTLPRMPQFRQVSLDDAPIQAQSHQMIYDKPLPLPNIRQSTYG